MPKKPTKLRPDVAEVAFRTMLEATGQAPKTTPPPSERVEKNDHAHAVSLFFLYYNYCRPHQSLTQGAKVKTTPAMAAGLADRVWAVEDIVAKMDPETARIE